MINYGGTNPPFGGSPAPTRSAVLDEKLAMAKWHYDKGRLDQAEGICRELLDSTPQNAAVLHYLGLVLLKQGQYDQAAEQLSKAVKLNPRNAEAHNTLGCALKKLDRLDEAMEAFVRFAKLKPNSGKAWHNIASVHSQQKRYAKAVTLYRKAIKLSPARAKYHNSIGCAFGHLEKLGLAATAFRRATELDAGHVDALRNLGQTCMVMGELDDAVDAYRRLLHLTPDDPVAVNSLGCVLSRMGELEESRELFERALSLDGDQVYAVNNIGMVADNLGRFDEALTWYERAIQIQPDYPPAHFNWSLMKLRSGELTAEAWSEYKWRSQCEFCKKAMRDFDQPRWEGEPLAGKRILLHWEQGFGDTIHFSRYVPLVAERGGCVILECQTQLLPLLKGLSGVEEIVSVGSPLPQFDTYCPLGSLPGVFQTTLDTIPADVPYLHARPEDVETWRDRLGPRERFRVALVWAGNQRMSNDRARSIPFTSLAPLLEIEGAKFYSLQVDQRSRELKCPLGRDVVDLSKNLPDFAATAAAISQMDLLISVDTAPAHLAGALGTDVWLLIPNFPDWRWMLDRSDSPWYPTMRIFRQAGRGDWAGTIKHVAEALRERIAEENG